MRTTLRLLLGLVLLTFALSGGSFFLASGVSADSPALAALAKGTPTTIPASRTRQTPTATATAKARQPSATPRPAAPQGPAPRWLHGTIAAIRGSQVQFRSQAGTVQLTLSPQSRIELDAKRVSVSQLRVEDRGEAIIQRDAQGRSTVTALLLRRQPAAPPRPMRPAGRLSDAGEGQTNISTLAPSGGSPRLARDSQGHIYGAWFSDAGLVYARWDGTAWGTPQPISAITSAYQFAFTVDGQDNLH